MWITLIEQRRTLRFTYFLYVLTFKVVVGVVIYASSFLRMPTNISHFFQLCLSAFLGIFFEEFGISFQILFITPKKATTFMNSYEGYKTHTWLFVRYHSQAIPGPAPFWPGQAKIVHCVKRMAVLMRHNFEIFRGILCHYGPPKTTCIIITNAVSFFFHNPGTFLHLGSKPSRRKHQTMLTLNRWTETRRTAGRPRCKVRPSGHLPRIEWSRMEFPYTTLHNELQGRCSLIKASWITFQTQTRTNHMATNNLADERTT